MIIKKLTDVLIELSAECENDPKFNDWLSEKNIFSRSLDEIINDLLNNPA